MRFEVHGASSVEQVEAYLPRNYQVLGVVPEEERLVVVCEGVDNAGWTYDDYVQPRLASGLMRCEQLLGYESRTSIEHGAL